MVALWKRHRSKYATTRDGVKIAYTVAGHGPAVIWTPFIWTPFIWNDLTRLWSTSLMAPILRLLAKRYQVIAYDSRGQGCSQRGLREDHRWEDYLLDLEAVLDATRVERAAIYAQMVMGWVVLAFAQSQPERVARIILRDVRLSVQDV